MQIAVFDLASHASENWWSAFLVLDFLTVTDYLGDIGLLSVNYLVVDNNDKINSSYYDDSSANVAAVPNSNHPALTRPATEKVKVN